MYQQKRFYSTIIAGLAYLVVRVMCSEQPHSSGSGGPQDPFPPQLQHAGPEFPDCSTCKLSSVGNVDNINTADISKYCHCKFNKFHDAMLSLYTAGMYRCNADYHHLSSILTLVYLVDQDGEVYLTRMVRENPKCLVRALYGALGVSTIWREVKKPLLELPEAAYLKFMTEGSQLIVQHGRSVAAAIASQEAFDCTFEHIYSLHSYIPLADIIRTQLLILDALLKKDTFADHYQVYVVYQLVTYIIGGPLYKENNTAEAEERLIKLVHEAFATVLISCWPHRRGVIRMLAQWLNSHCRLHFIAAVNNYVLLPLSERKEILDLINSTEMLVPTAILKKIREETE